MNVRYTFLLALERYYHKTPFILHYCEIASNVEGRWNTMAKYMLNCGSNTHLYDGGKDEDNTVLIYE